MVGHYVPSQVHASSTPGTKEVSLRNTECHGNLERMRSKVLVKEQTKRFQDFRREGRIQGTSRRAIRLRYLNFSHYWLTQNFNPQSEARYPMLAPWQDGYDSNSLKFAERGKVSSDLPGFQQKKNNRLVQLIALTSKGERGAAYKHACITRTLIYPNMIDLVGSWPPVVPPSSYLDPRFPPHMQVPRR